MEEKEFRFCPDCGATELDWFMGGKLGDQYKCRKCNYIGPVLKGNAKFIGKFKKELEVKQDG